MRRAPRTEEIEMGKFELTASLFLAAIFTSPALATPSPRAQQQLIMSVNRRSPQLHNAASEIWKVAETGYHETRSSALLQRMLRDGGFTVKAGILSMPTSFIASYRTGDGPVIAILGEFDALPGASQAILPQRESLPGQAAGHACGHNLFGAASATAALAIKDWMVANGIKGEIRMYGTPAEEGGEAKVYMARAGLFGDVDTVLHWHPSDHNTASYGQTLANISAKFRFHGIAAHAAAAPDRGRSVLDGVEAMDAMINQMREHMPQDARIHNIITAGGDAPNIVPPFAESYYTVRHFDIETTKALFERVRKTAEAAALGTGTTMDYEIVGGVYSLLANQTLNKVMDANLHIVGRRPFDEKEKAFARKISDTLPGKPYHDGDEVKIAEYESEARAYASADAGDISWNVPTAGVLTSTWVEGTVAHSWQATAASGMSIGFGGAEVAAKVIALTAAELFETPEIIKAAKSELMADRGKDFSYTPLLGDRDPQIDYRSNGHPR